MDKISMGSMDLRPIEACFLACDDLDKAALIPVSQILAVMREAA